MICYLYDAPVYLIFGVDVPSLLYYSHIPATIVALLIGIFVYLSGRNVLLNKLLFFIALSFSAWTVSSLIAWTNNSASLIAALWPLFAISASLISILSIYFIYVFLNKKDAPFLYKVSFLLLLAPVFLFAHTNINISGFDLTNCDAFKYEWVPFKFYYNFLGLVSFIWILLLLTKAYRSATSEFKKQILLMGVGIEFFIFSFISSTFLITYLVNHGLLVDSRLEMYGLFGMMFFMVMISTLIVKYRTFKVTVITAQALVIALLVLNGSQFTYVSSQTGKILTAITLLFTLGIGIILIRSVKKEIKQKEKNKKLVIELERANTRLTQMDKLKSEFVSIASHQLRSPITAISGYASLICEGTYGEMPDKMKDPMNRIVQSARMMAESIEDYLNVSRIEAGNMKYNYEDFNLADEAEHICDDLRPEALKCNLILLYRKRINSRGVVNSDQGKVQQIIHNLINNAIKYTPKGAITIYVHDNITTKRIYIDFMDTGIGMNQDTIHSIFQKFERGDQANSVNVKGTGLGLYVAQKMAEAMGGSITAHSDGEGKGSRFTLELPLVM